MRATEVINAILASGERNSRNACRTDAFSSAVRREAVVFRPVNGHRSTKARALPLSDGRRPSPDGGHRRGEVLMEVESTHRRLGRRAR